MQSGDLSFQVVIIASSIATNVDMIFIKLTLKGQVSNFIKKK